MRLREKTDRETRIKTEREILRQRLRDRERD